MGEVHDIYLETFGDEFFQITVLVNDYSPYNLKKLYETVEKFTVSTDILDEGVVQ